MGYEVRSTFLCTKAFLKNMKDRRYGHIVNNASVAGKRGFATERVYCASKFAQVGFADY